MPTDAILGWPYPANTDAPAGAAEIMALVTAAAGGSGNATPVLRAVDSADRDAKYGGTLTPIGSLVVTSGGAPQSMWLKVGTSGVAGADWKLLWQSKQSWTPVVTRVDTGATVSSSPVTAASYWYVLGGVAHVHGETVLNADTNGGCAVSLPIASPQRYFGIGVCGLFGSTPVPPSDQSGLAYMLDTSHLVVTAFTNGYRDGSATQTLRFSVSYSIL